MEIKGINNYPSYTNYYTDTRKKSGTESTETAADRQMTGKTSDILDSKAESAPKAGRKEYLSSLGKRHASLNIMAGGVNTGYRGGNYPNKVDVMIAPSILDKMASDPEAAQKYEKMLSDIPMCEKWANSMIKAITGSEVKYRQVWIDENGNMGSFSICGPSEKQKKQDAVRRENEQKAFEERLKAVREEARESRKQIAERMLAKKIENSKDGELFFNHEDMQLLIQAAGETDSRNNAEGRGTGAYFDARK